MRETEIARGRTVLVQPKKKKKGCDRERGSSLGCVPPKSDLPPPSDSYAPHGKGFFFFFFIVKIYGFGYILIFGWIDIDLGVWLKFDFD